MVGMDHAVRRYFHDSRQELHSPRRVDHEIGGSRDLVRKRLHQVVDLRELLYRTELNGPFNGWSVFYQLATASATEV